MRLFVKSETYPIHPHPGVVHFLRLMPATTGRADEAHSSDLWLAAAWLQVQMRLFVKSETYPIHPHPGTVHLLRLVTVFSSNASLKRSGLSIFIDAPRSIGSILKSDLDLRGHNPPAISPAKAPDEVGTPGVERHRVSTHPRPPVCRSGNAGAYPHERRGIGTTCRLFARCRTST
jgi:hypothetical protein